MSAPAGGKAFPDQTPPVILSANARRSGDSVQIGISAQDAESGVRYFSYSVNGGVTWSPLQRWAADGANASYTVPDSVQIGISAQDAESGVRYFSYSVNGGVTWSPLQRWAADGANASYTVPAPAGTDYVMVRVQNAYDLTADTVVQAG